MSPSPRPTFGQTFRLTFRHKSLVAGSAEDFNCKSTAKRGAGYCLGHRRGRGLGHMPPPRHRPPLPRGLLYQKLANEFREFSEYFAEISRLSAQVKQPFLNEVHRDFSYTFNCCFKDVPGLLDDPKYLLVPALHEYSFG